VKKLNDKKLIVHSKKYKGDSSVVSARLPMELIRDIDLVATKTGRTRNEIILMCLEFSFENLEIKINKEE
jgi:predicted DNA-binding protein